MVRHVVALGWVVAAAASGCELLAPYATTSNELGVGRGDAGSTDGSALSGDGAPRDLAPESSAPDAAEPDLTSVPPDLAADVLPPDLPWPDLASDLASDQSGDQSGDLSPGDLAPADQSPGDLAPEDLAADSPPPDLPPADLPPADLLAADQAADQDLVVSEACSALGTAEHVVSSSMVVCQSVDVTTYSQCTADQLCNASKGWALCPASRYQAQFRAAPAPVVGAWVAGCIRDGPLAFTAPTDTICSECNAVEIVPPVNFGWSCTDGKAVSAGKPERLGVASDIVCRRLGIDDPSTAAYWQPEAAINPFTRAVCCRP